MGLDNRTYIHGQGFHSMSTVSKERWQEIFGKYPKTMKRLAESERAEVVKHCYCATKIIRNDGCCETCGGRVK